MNTQSSNFAFLATHDEQLVRLGTLAEKYFKEDPGTSLIKIRQFGEVLAQLTAASSGLYTDQNENQYDLLQRLRGANILQRETNDLFHQLRLVGNRATHQDEGDHAQALASIKIARQLGIWFHRTFSNIREGEEIRQILIKQMHLNIGSRSQQDAHICVTTGDERGGSGDSSDLRGREHA